MALLIPCHGDLLFSIICHVQTFPLKRPRARILGKYASIYQPLSNQRELRQAFKSFKTVEIDEPIIVDCFLSQVKAKTTKFQYPIGRIHGDDDNLRKAVCDALQAAGIIKDDARIIGGCTYKVYSTEPITLVKIYRPSNQMMEIIP